MRILSVLAVLFAITLGTGLATPARAQMEPAVVRSVQIGDQAVVPAAWGGRSIKSMPIEQLVMIGLGAGAGVYAAEMFLAGMGGGQLAMVGGLIIGALVGDRMYKELF